MGKRWLLRMAVPMLALLVMTPSFAAREKESGKEREREREPAPKVEQEKEKPRKEKPRAERPQRQKRQQEEESCPEPPREEPRKERRQREKPQQEKPRAEQPRERPRQERQENPPARVERQEREQPRKEARPARRPRPQPEPRVQPEPRPRPGREGRRPEQVSPREGTVRERDQRPQRPATGTGFLRERVRERPTSPQAPRTAEARRLRERLLGSIRAENRTFTGPRSIPRDAVPLDRNRISHLRDRHQLMANRLGPPRHRYVFTPHGGVLHPVVISYWYSNYHHGEPWWTGNHHGQYHRPVYYHYDWGLDWFLPLLGSIILDQDPDYIDWGGSPYNLDYRGVNATLDDIEDAWVTGDICLFADHLPYDYPIGVQVYFGAEYQYTISVADFYAMTADALATIQVTKMEFGYQTWISPREVYVSGWQDFIDPAGEWRRKNVAYRLRRIGSRWCIVAFYSSSSDELLLLPSFHRRHRR